MVSRGILSSHREDPLPRKTTLFTCSICIPLFVLSFPMQLSLPGLTSGKGLTANLSFEHASAAACAEKLPMKDIGGADTFAAGFPTADDCSDAIDKCKKPIKYLGSKGLCACFACEYGQTTQHNICTQNKKDKQTLLAKSKEH